MFLLFSYVQFTAKSFCFDFVSKIDKVYNLVFWFNYSSEGFILMWGIVRHCFCFSRGFLLRSCEQKLGRLVLCSDSTKCIYFKGGLHIVVIFYFLPICTVLTRPFLRSYGKKVPNSVCKREKNCFSRVLNILLHSILCEETTRRPIFVFPFCCYPSSRMYIT